MAREIVTEDGRVFKLVAGQMIDITPSAEAAAAAKMGFVESAGAVAAEGFKDIGLSLLDLGATAAAAGATRPRGAAAPRQFDAASATKLRANILEQSTQNNARIDAIREARPGAAFVGDLATAAPAMLIPGAAPVRGAAGVARLLGTEAAIAGGEGFIAQPGALSERLKTAGEFAAFGAGGAGVFRAGSQLANSTSNAFKRYRGTGDFEGTAAITAGRSPIDFEIATGAPRLGPKLEAEYNKLASRAPVKRSKTNPGDTTADFDGLTDFEIDLVTEADNLGLALSRGDRTGSRQTVALEDALANNIATSRPWQRMAEFNERRLADITLDRLGETPGKGSISGGDLGRADKRISDGFESLKADIDGVGGIPVDDVLLDTLGEIEMQNRKGVAGSKGVVRFVKELRNLAGASEAVEAVGDVAGSPRVNGELTGKWFVDTRSSLTRELQKAARAGDGNTLEGVWKMIDSLDDAMQRSELPRAVKDNYELLRDQWRIKTVLEQGKVVTKGKVNAVSADTALRKMYPHEYLRADVTGDPFFDSVKILSHYDRPRNSLTAARQSINDLVNQNVVKGAIRLGAGATLGEVAFRGTRRGLGGTDLFEGGLLSDPARSAARIGTVSGIAAAQGDDAERR